MYYVVIHILHLYLGHMPIWACAMKHTTLDKGRSFERLCLALGSILSNSVCVSQKGYGLYSSTWLLISLCMGTSQLRLGAVLIHDDKYVHYGSIPFTLSECNYAQIEKELLLAIF